MATALAGECDRPLGRELAMRNVCRADADGFREQLGLCSLWRLKRWIWALKASGEPAPEPGGNLV